MIPRDTHYRLACSPADYRRCRAFLAERMAVHPLSFPTVYAERDGRVIGVLATQPPKKAIIAGPLAVEGRSPFTALRLIEAYDRVMREAGVDYHFHVAVANASWRRVVEQMGLRPFHEDEHGVWYRRILHAA